MSQRFDLPADLELLSAQELLGIPLALVAGLLVAIGAQFQHHGVGAAEAGVSRIVRSGLDRLVNLMRQPTWHVGTLILFLAITLQLFSLFLAPISVVQPLGVLGLVFATIVNARVSRVSLGRSARWAVALCAIGVASFVIIAALVTRPHRVSAIETYELVGVVVAISVGIGVACVFFRRALTPMFFVVSAGVLFGLVATLAKISMDRTGELVRNGEPPTAAAVVPIVLSVAALTIAALFGSVLVHRAYVDSTPDVVMAGLTVIDPIVAVTMGALILQEFPGAQPWIVVMCVCSAAVAILGVCRLAIAHPNAKAQSAR